MFTDIITEYRYAITQKRDRLLQFIDLFDDLCDIHRTLRLQHLHFTVRKGINTGIGLVSARIHKRTHKVFHAPQIIGKSVHRRDLDNGLVQCQSQAFCSGRSDTKAGKRAGSLCDRDGIHGLQIQIDHLCNCIQHGKQRLRMCFFIIHGVLTDQIVVLCDSYTCHKP